MYEPIGTDSEPIAILVPSFVRSWTEPISEPFGTASTNSLVANSTGWSS